MDDEVNPSTLLNLRRNSHAYFTLEFEPSKALLPVTLPSLFALLLTSPWTKQGSSLFSLPSSPFPLLKMIGKVPVASPPPRQRGEGLGLQVVKKKPPVSSP